MTVATLEPTKQYKLSGWDLSELLPEPSDALINDRLDTLEEAVDAFVAKRASLSPDMDPDDLVRIVKELEDISERLYVLFAYVTLFPYTTLFRSRKSVV